MQERAVTVRVKEGLHARPATRFVKLAKSFTADIDILYKSKTASAKSSVKVMLLAVKEGEEIILRCNGTDEADALGQLVAYLENPLAGLDADDAPAKPGAKDAVPAASHPAGQASGIGASEGIATGPVFAFFAPALPVDNRIKSGPDVSTEQDKAARAFDKVAATMQAQLAIAGQSDENRAIISALMELATDEVLRIDIIRAIGKGQSAVSAIQDIAAAQAAEFAKLDDPYQRARGDDITAIGRMLAFAAAGLHEPDLSAVPPGSIVIAHDIGAFELAKAPLKNIAGLICAIGGPTSHIAIIARSHGVPAILGAGPEVETWRNAKTIVMDGKTGEVIPDPTPGQLAPFEQRRDKLAKDKLALAAFKDLVPKRADGKIIEVAANIGTFQEAQTAKEAGAMGVGLFRTELLFMQQRGLPSEDQQAETYGKVAALMKPHPVIIRTLDVGGDKPVGGIAFPHEENPFLGWRGIRMCLDRPDVFKPQLRALLRASVHGNIKVMIPMVVDAGEVRRTKELVAQCAQELANEGVAFGTFELGIMVETPAAVFNAAELAKESAFFSIGTNDLTQYVMAADRLNTKVAALNNAGCPAVMGAIALVAKAGTEAGIMVGMCGDAAAREDLIPEFIRMGITELSMSAGQIAKAKRAIMKLAGGV